MKTEQTRLFFVVDSLILNEEIFETLEKAEEYFGGLGKKLDDKPRLYIAVVKNAYRESRNYIFDCYNIDEWNYNDLSNTFEIIKQLK